MEQSYIKTSHEEVYSKGDVSKTIGVITNWDSDGNRIDSFPYIYSENIPDSIYIIFDTMIGMFDYLLYGDKKTKRAYIKEDRFDDMYDNNLNGKFTDHFNWIES